MCIVTRQVCKRHCVIAHLSYLVWCKLYFCCMLYFCDSGSEVAARAYCVVLAAQDRPSGPVNDLLLQLQQGLPDGMPPFCLLLSCCQIGKLLSWQPQQALVACVCFCSLLHDTDTTSHSAVCLRTPKGGRQLYISRLQNYLANMDNLERYGLIKLTAKWHKLGPL